MSEENTNQDSNDTPPPIETARQLRIGDMIREAREAKNVSIKVISQHTKISVTMLEALESNQLGELPNKTYVIGYIKSCAKVLDLDPTECLNVLEKNYRELDPRPIVDELEPMPDAEKEASENNQALIIVFAIIAILSIGFIYVVSNQSSETVAEKEEVIEKVEEKKEEKIVEVKEVTDSDVKPQVLSADTPLKQDSPEDIVAKEESKEEKEVIDEATQPVVKVEEVKEEKKADKKKEDKKNDDKIDLKPIKSNLYSVIDDSDDEAKEDIPGQYISSVLRGKQNVFVKAVKGDTWLTYKEDENPIKKFVLKKDRYILIRGEEVLLFLGNLGAVKVYLNNKLLKLTSRSGVKSLVFPQENKDDHFYPLFIYKKDGTVMSSKEYKAQLDN